jgi:1-deoxy-D-xylulose-5-phosphate synthase
MPNWQTPFEKITIGTGRKIKEGKDLAVLTIGHPGNFAVKACQQLMEDGIDAAHYDLRFVKPLDEKLMHEIGRKFTRIITVEDGAIQGGFGSAVLEFLNANSYKPEVRILGIPDRVIEHGKQEEQRKECGFDTEDITAAALDMMHETIIKQPVSHS